MKKRNIPAEYTLTMNLLAFLNILVAVLIIVYAYHLIDTELGKAIIALGYLTITISTALKVAKKW